MGRRDNEDITDARQHKGRKRVIDHWLIIYRHYLFADSICNRM